MTRALIVYVTVASRKEADRIADTLVKEKLAACVSIVTDLYSRYWWKGRIEYAKELMLVIKTTPRRYKTLEKRIGSLHDYSVPEILATPVVEGNSRYLAWLKETVG